MFSEVVPGLQVVWDATSANDLMACPRRYQLHILEGWRGAKKDTAFGGYAAEGFEVFHKARLSGKSKAEATRDALRHVLEATWIADDHDGDGHSEHDQGHPWGGRYETLWHCTGTTKYKNSKGNAAKCPWSHKGAWFPGPHNDTCSCGSPIEEQRRFVADDTVKNRKTLVRLVVWYCIEQPDEYADGLQAIRFPDGTPAVEKHFLLPTPWKYGTGEPITLAGYFDRISRFGDEHFITDNKTTKNPLDRGYWAHYSPNTQVDTYDLVGSILYPSLSIQGVAIEAAQTLVGGAKFGIQVFHRTEPQREEFAKDLEYWLGKAEEFVRKGYWPKNPSACYTCDFKKICSLEPANRERFLAADFTKRAWNPAEERQ